MKKSTPSATPRPGVQRLRHHRGVEVEVVALAGGAGAAVGDVDRHLAEVARSSAPLVGSDGIPRVGIAGRGDHRPDRGEVDACARRRRIARRDRARRPARAARRRIVAGPPRGHPGQHLVVGLAMPAVRRALGRHVGERRALVGRQRAQARRRRTPSRGRASLLLRVVGEDVQHHVLGGDARRAARPVSSKRIDSGHLDDVKPECTSAAYSVAPDAPRERVVARRPCRCGCRWPG